MRRRGQGPPSLECRRTSIPCARSVVVARPHSATEPPSAQAPPPRGSLLVIQTLFGWASRATDSGDTRAKAEEFWSGCADWPHVRAFTVLQCVSGVVPSSADASFGSLGGPS